MPAMSDMHTHAVGSFRPPGGFQQMSAERIATTALYAGVARYLDLFSPEDSIFATRARRLAAKTSGADILVACRHNDSCRAVARTEVGDECRRRRIADHSRRVSAR